MTIKAGSMYDKRLKKQREMRKKHMLTGGQAKIAAKAPPPNKIDEKDFAVLRAEKAKGRGMGLQDEKVKPGKVQKANLGLMFMKKAKDKGAKGAEFLSPLAMLKRLSGKKMGGVAKYKRGSGLDLPVISSVKPSVHKTKKAQKTAVMKEQFNKQKSRMGKNPNKTLDSPKAADKFLKRRKELGAAGKALAATRIGKIALGVGAAGVAAQQYLKSKMNKKKDVKKKMTGGMIEKLMANKKSFANPISPVTMPEDRKNQTTGLMPQDRKIQTTGPILRARDKKMGGGMMMQKPMGYNKGVMVKARGCKLGRTRPTKIT